MHIVTEDLDLDSILNCLSQIRRTPEGTKYRIQFAVCIPGIVMKATLLHLRILENLQEAKKLIGEWRDGQKKLDDADETEMM